MPAPLQEYRNVALRMPPPRELNTRNPTQRRQCPPTTSYLRQNSSA